MAIKDMLTVDQVASKFDVSRNTIVRLIKKGNIQAKKIGRQYRIPEESYESFAKLSEVNPYDTSAVRVKNK